MSKKPFRFNCLRQNNHSKIFSISGNQTWGADGPCPVDPSAPVNLWFQAQWYKQNFEHSGWLDHSFQPIRV